ncbi:hypothetical protein H4582DRAFT_2100059 [Lactarius indigo]|nr:hypothetical protein H4582DRAFT_2100059 [Lactarius indigo]
MSLHSVRPVSSSSLTKPVSTIGDPNSYHWHPLLLNDSPPGTASHGPYKDLETQDTTWILCEKRGEVQSQDESHGYTITINILPDDVLLEIFDECRKSHDLDQPSAPVWRWHRLVHVCQRWRQLVFESPRRLDLQLLCTHGTPTRENLGCWPPFPIAIHYNRNGSLTPNDEDSVFAALEHPGRVRYIDLRLIGHRSEDMVMAMQEPFPELTHLTLQVGFGGRLALPSGFLGGSAPRLRHIHLEGILFPKLPTLLSSTNDLVHLHLDQIPQGGYISPEAMVACLAALPRLKSLRIKYRSVKSHPDRIRPSPETRTLLPVLTSFVFQGASEYLEDLVAQIDSPQLNQIHAQYLNQLFDFQVARLFKFIDRLQAPELTLIRRADVSFSHPWVTFKMYPHPESHPDWDRICALIRCDAIEGQVSRIAQVFSQHSAMLSRVVHLKLSNLDNASREGGEWPLLLRKLSSMRTLRISGRFARHVTLALEDLAGEMAAEVLPVLDLIYLDDQPVTSVEKFLTARRISGRPVTIADTEAEFDERMRTYANE